MSTSAGVRIWSAKKKSVGEAAPIFLGPRHAAVTWEPFLKKKLYGVPARGSAGKILIPQKYRARIFSGVKLAWRLPAPDGDRNFSPRALGRALAPGGPCQGVERVSGRSRSRRHGCGWTVFE
jgi:hypothetical protein